MTPINNNQMSELDKIIQEYAEILEEKLKLEPMTTDWIHRIIFFNTENLKADISTLINSERAEAVRGFVDWVKKNEEDEQKAQCLREMSFISFDNRWINSLKEMIEEYLSSERFK